MTTTKVRDKATTVTNEGAKGKIPM